MQSPEPLEDRRPLDGPAIDAAWSRDLPPLLPSCGRDLTRPLRAWWVGDDDIIAAEDAAQALALANDQLGPLTPWTADEVVEVAPATLDEQHAGEDGPWTLRQLLAETTEPGYLAGYEQ